MGQANNFQCPSLSLRIHLAKKRAEIFVHRYAAVITSELKHLCIVQNINARVNAP